MKEWRNVGKEGKVEDWRMERKVEEVAGGGWGGYGEKVGRWRKE